MINSSTALASIVAVILVLLVVVDAECRLRIDRVDGSKPLIWQIRDNAVASAVNGVKGAFRWVFRRGGKPDAKPANGQDERTPLLGGN